MLGLCDVDISLFGALVHNTWAALNTTKRRGKKKMGIVSLRLRDIELRLSNQFGGSVALTAFGLFPV